MVDLCGNNTFISDFESCQKINHMQMIDINGGKECYIQDCGDNIFAFEWDLEASESTSLWILIIGLLLLVIPALCIGFMFWKHN